MNECTRYMMFAVLGFVACGMITNAAWSWIPVYQYDYNITVPNWNYTTITGFNYTGAGFALVRLSNVVSPSTMATRGYNSGNTPRGSVPFWVVSTSGSNVVVLISNHTNTSRNWSYVTLYYGPTNSTSGIITGYQNPASQRSYGYLNQRFNVFGPISSRAIGLTSNSSAAFSINFSMNASYALVPNPFLHSVLVVSNRTLAGRPFNITWTPTDLIAFDLSSTGIGYRLSSFMGGNVVYPFAGISNAANQIFGPTNTVSGYSNGFEGWFSDSANQVFSEGMGKVGGRDILEGSQICNIFGACTGTGFNPSLKQYLMTINMTAGANVPDTTFDILPAFSSNYLVSNGVNPHPSFNTTILCISQYQIQQIVTNITWNYTFMTYATGNSEITRPVSFKFNNVGYAEINFTNFGDSCANMHINASSGTTNLGYVPYYLLNCSLNNPNARMIIPNRTSLGNGYNSIIIYSGGNINTAGPYGISNGIILNDWQFSSNTVSGYLSIPGQPFIIKLQRQLNFASYIELTSYSYGQNIFYQISHTGYDQIIPTPPWQSYGNVIDSSGFHATTFLYGYPQNSVFASKNLMEYGEEGFNQTAGFVSYFIFQHTQFIYINITNNSYVEEHLYTTNYTESNLQSISCTINGTTTTIPFIQVPYTLPPNNGIQLNDTTTININESAATVTLAAGVQFPKAGLIIIALILFLIGCSMLSIHELGHFPFLIALLGLWVLGFYTISLFLIALVGTAAFIIEEYIDRKSSGSVFYRG